MSRLAQKSSGSGRGEVSFTPSAEEIYTAAGYSERIKEKKSQMDAVKNAGAPVGWAPPLDPEKMKRISEMGSIPSPSFEDPPQERTTSGSSYFHKEPEVETPKKEAGKLSAETIKALEAVKAANKEEGAGMNPSFEDPTEEEMERVAEEATSVPEFDFASISSHREFLVSKKRREAIEKTLAPLDLADMVTRREIQQTVEIVQSKLNYTFRTFNQHEHLFCLRYIYEFPGSALYVNELLNTCKLVCSLVAINGALLPEHRKDVGTSREQVDKDLFLKKMFHVASFPTQMIADMSVQAVWFDERVSKLFSLENLKNG